MKLRRDAWLVVIAGSLLTLSGCSSPSSSSVSSSPAPRVIEEADPELGRLIVFVQPGSDLARSFEQDDLPQIVALTQELGITATVVDATSAAPTEVSLTPQLVFQNHRGRSVFEGRYASLDRLRNFLRTARRAPLGPATHAAKDTLVWQAGRVTLTAPIKVGKVTGHPPRGYEHDAFQQEAIAAIDDAQELFRRESEVQLSRGDRAFYMDFYPYLAEDGTLYVSTALFSQFHCKQAVYISPPDAPHVGPWSERASVFARAARSLEAELRRQLASSEHGDGFAALGDDTPLASWAALGLDLPDAPPEAPASAARGPLPQSWALDTSDANSDATPSLLFHLAAPLDSYRGEVSDLQGRLDSSTPTAGGELVARGASVSMGDPDLDKWIHSAAVLDVKQFPEARFSLDTMTLDQALAWGRLSPMTGQGHFSMRGQTIPMQVRAELEPLVDEAGKTVLAVSGSFDLSLGAPWSVDVPVGDAPENRQLVFDFEFELSSADG